MSTEQKSSDMRRLWQSQVVAGTSMSVDELRSALARLNRVERRRTWVGALFFLIFAGALGAVLIGVAPNPPNPIVRGGECFLALGAAFFFFQVMLGLRRAPGKLLSSGEPQACASFYASVLERQQRFYRRSALWVSLLISACLLPIILLAPPLRVIMTALWVILVPFWIYESMGLARRSQGELDRLNASLR